MPLPRVPFFLKIKILDRTTGIAKDGAANNYTVGNEDCTQSSVWCDK
jgi:hypothetical protein